MEIINIFQFKIRFYSEKMRFVLLALVFASAVYAVSFKDIELVGFSWDSCGIVMIIILC